MTDKDTILTFLTEHKAKLFNDYQLVKLGLFGTFAQNEETADSSIELIVDFLPNTESLYDKKTALSALLQTQFGREVLICREKYLKPYFHRYVLQSAIYV